MTKATPPYPAASTLAGPTPQFKGQLRRTILLVLLPLTLLPLLLLGAGTYVRSYAFLRSQIITQLTTVVEGQASLIQARMQAKESFLRLLTSDPNFSIPLTTALRLDRGSPAYTGVRDQLLFDFNVLRGTESEPSFKAFFIANPDKVIIIASNPNWEGISLSGSPMEPLLGKTGSMALYDARPVYPNIYTVVSAHAVSGAGGEVRATVFGLADEAATRRDLLGSVVIAPQTRSYIYTKDAVLVGLNPNQSGLQILAQPNPGQRASLEALASGGQPQSVLSFDNTRVFGYAKYLPGLQSVLVVELPQQAVFAPLRPLPLFLGLLVLGTLLVLGAIIWLGATSLTRPLLQLTQATTGFADGEWNLRAPVKRDDEIGLLAYSFNRMADELTTLYWSLESKVEARTRQVRAASEAAQMASSAPTLPELLRRTVSLIIERFGYFDASVFLVDETGTQASLAETGEAASALKRGHNYRLPVGGNSTIGWVTAHNLARVTSDAQPDSLELKNELFPETHSEATLPISVGDYVLGALDVQSVDPRAFSPEDVAMLQTLANQIATTLQNIRLLESTKVNLAETSLLYQTSRQVSQAATQPEIFEILARALSRIPFTTGIFSIEADGLAVVSLSSSGGEERTVPAHLPVDLQDVLSMLPADRPYLAAEVQKPGATAAAAGSLPAPLRDLLASYGCATAAVFPMKLDGIPSAFMVLGSEATEPLSATAAQPYASLAELVSTALEKVAAQESMQQRLNELQVLNKVGETISTLTDLPPILQELHQAVEQSLGPVNFLVALYDEGSQMIQIPYVMENGRRVTIEPFPLGDGLTSIVLRSRQPLLLNDLSEEKLKELGARTIGAPPRSWLGIPFMVGGQVFGAMVAQDLEKANRFSETDVRLLATLAAQVAGSLRNALLLEQTRRVAERERILHEATSRIRNSASLQAILETSAAELSKALHARRAHIQIEGPREAPEGPAEPEAAAQTQAAGEPQAAEIHKAPGKPEAGNV